MSSVNLWVEALDVILRDGGTLRLRAPREADRDALVRFFEDLSPRSLFLRFHGTPRVDEHLVEPVLDPDWVERGSLLASVTEDGVDRIVALANYVRLRDPRSAEVAFAVADDYQGRGIATRMLERLAALAGPRGIERFVGEVMADNAAMIGVFEGVGFEVSRTLEGGEVEMTFPIAVTADYASHVEARDHTGGRRVAAPVLRSSDSRGHRGVVAERNDRRRALPKHHRGRIRGVCLSDQSQRRAGSWCPRICLHRGDPGSR